MTITEAKNPFDFIKKVTTGGNELKGSKSECGSLTEKLKEQSIWAIAKGNNAKKSQEKIEKGVKKSQKNISIWNQEINKIDSQIETLYKEQNTNDGTGEGENSAYSLVFSTDKEKCNDNENKNTRSTNTTSTKNEGIIAELSAKRGNYTQHISKEIKYNSRNIKSAIEKIKQDAAKIKEQKEEEAKTIETAQTVSAAAGITGQVATFGKTVVAPACASNPVTAAAAPVVGTTCTIAGGIAAGTKITADITAVQANSSLEDSEKTIGTLGSIAGGLTGLGGLFTPAKTKEKK